MTNSTCVYNAFYPDICPIGCICDGTGNRFNCSLMIDSWKSVGLGVIHDGAYCPEFSNKIQNCPIGFYCPDPETKLPCPAGKFCPHKTKVPQIICHRCGEGATRLESETYGYIIFFLFCAVASSLLAYKYIRQSRKKTEKEKKKLQERLINAEKIALLKKKQRQRIERLTPKVKAIYDQIGLPWNHVDELNYLSIEKLYNALDSTGDDFASYEELNVGLKLSDTQLQWFSNIMNKRAGEPLDCKRIHKYAFVDFFFDTIEQVANYDPTPEDAAKLYEAVAFQQTGNSSAPSIVLSGLINTDLMFFLSFSQVLKIIRSLQNSLSNKEESFSLIRQWSRSVIINEERATIGKDEFIAQYPIALYQATHKGFDQQLARGIDIMFEDVSLNVTVGGQTSPVLEKLTGRLQKKSMTALMGASGAGKTSLLNALCGRAFYGEVTGKIMINGIETTIDKHIDVVGFVPQDDIVYSELTVKENLIFSGRFRLPNGTSNREIEDLADEVMADLGLSRVANNIVGDVTRRGVSGGEKKRVNIGLELMANPLILFLDEPTSGLDASSAMLVMKSLKSLVEKKGMTVCSVIHQPRKFIFDLFDSLILLGIGGKMLYHGPPTETETYFGNLGYYLSGGESIADWLIDISTGQLSPTNNAQVTSRRRSSFGMDVESRLAPAGKEKNTETANMNRATLINAWENYFNNLEEQRKSKYLAPKPSPLPDSRTLQPFWKQLMCHIERNFLVQRRNIVSKVTNVFIITLAGILICILDGKLPLTSDKIPNLPNEYEILTTVGISPENSRAIFSSLYSYTVPNIHLVQFALKIGVVVGTLISLSAAKVLTEKRLELFREAGSGYNLNAYYLAVNITSTIEHTILIIIVAVAVIWLRVTITSEICGILNFIMIGWLTTSWSLFFPLIVPPRNLVLVLSFFIVFFTLMFSGGMSPTTFTEIYGENKVYAFISGFFSCSRFFLETYIVSETRALPPQSGFTLTNEVAPGLEDVSLDNNLNAYNMVLWAQHDMPGASTQSRFGWYKQMLPPFLVGLTIRVTGAIMLQICYRSQQARPSFLTELKISSSYRLSIFLLFCAWLLLFGLSMWQIRMFR